MSAPSGLPQADQTIVDRATAAGQAQCFAWWDTLDGGQRRLLLDQLAGFDYDLIAELVAEHLGV